MRLPAILLLLAGGLLLGPIGPGEGLFRPEELFGSDLLQTFIELAVAIILFEGGLSLHLNEARFVGPTLWRLILSGLFLGFSLTTFMAMTVAELDLATSALLGGILVVTGPTVIIPMLRGARIKLRPATLLKWEGIVNDPLGVFMAYLVVQSSALAYGESTGFATQIFALIGMALVATMIGISAGVLLGWILERGGIPEHLKSPVILASVVVVFAAGQTLGHETENGLLSVTAMGLVLANVEHASIEDIRRFKEQVSTLLISLLFIVLSARLEPSQIEGLDLRTGLFVASVIFVVRPVVTLVATYGTELPWSERILIGWIAPRGIVAAAVAGAVPAGFIENNPDANKLLPIIFGVIVSTVVLHGLSIRPLARRLGLAASQANGILIVGASEWGVALGQALAKAGAFVVLADTRYRRVSRARMEGLDVHFGDVLSEESDFELPLERVSWVLSATDDDAYNSLVCLHFGPMFSRERVLQLTSVSRSKDSAVHMQGRSPWGEEGSYRQITRRYWKEGTNFKVTAISENFGFEDLKEQHPDALFLFALHDGQIRVLEADKAPQAGSKVVYLT